MLTPPRLVATATLITLSWAPVVVHGQPASWINSSGGFYETASNWVPGVVPGPTNGLIFGIPGNYDVGLLSDQTAAGLTIANSAGVTFTSAGAGSPDRRLEIGGDAEINNAGLLLGGDPAGGGFRLDIAGGFSILNNLGVGDTALGILENARVTSGDVLIDTDGAAVGVRGEQASWEIAGDLSLGQSEDGSTLRVFGGGSFTNTDDTRLGGLSAAIHGDGILTVGGPGLDAVPVVSTFTTGRNTLVGNFGAGTLAVLPGGVVESGNRTQVGFGAGSVGEVTVAGVDADGNRATWNPGLLTLGLGGFASVVIEDGGLATSGNATVGNDSSASVDVISAEWNVNGTLRIGLNALGRFDLANGGRLTSGTTSLGGTSAIGSNGQLFITGGVPSDPTTVWENSGDFYVGGTEDEGLGQGNFVIAGDTRADISGTVKIWSEGRVDISLGASFSADTIDHTLGGAFELEGGTLHVNRFDGDLLNPGGTLAPGVSTDTGLTTVFGDYTQQAGGVLSLDLGGTSAGGTHDLVNVTNDANFDGLLEVSLLAGYTPDAADTFTVLAADSLFGVFDNVSPGQRLDTADGRGSFVVNYGVGSAFDETRIVLTDFVAYAVGLPGDFNGDGAVDLLDLDILGANFGLTGTSLATGDANGDGTTDLLDLDILGANFGATAPAAVVPEPTTVGLLLMSALFVSHRGRLAL